MTGDNDATGLALQDVGGFVKDAASGGVELSGVKRELNVLPA